jgi:hypothetical protein
VAGAVEGLGDVEAEDAAEDLVEGAGGDDFEPDELQAANNTMATASGQVGRMVMSSPVR